MIFFCSIVVASGFLRTSKIIVSYCCRKTFSTIFLDPSVKVTTSLLLVFSLPNWFFIRINKSY